MSRSRADLIDSKEVCAEEEEDACTEAMVESLNAVFCSNDDIDCVIRCRRVSTSAMALEGG